VPDELRRPAVRRRRVAAYADLQVPDEAGPGHPLDDFAKGAVGQGVGQQPNSEFVIGAFQFRHNVWPAGGFVNGSFFPLGWRATARGVELLSVGGDGVMLDQLLVELEAKPGPFGHVQVPVAVDPWLGDQHLTQRG